MVEGLGSKRPQFLMVLCTLSIINGVYGMLSSLINALSPADVDERVLDELFERLAELNIPFDHLRGDMEQYFLNTMLNLINISAASFLFYGISLVAALMMIRLRKTGFWLYFIAQAGLALVPAFFGGFNAFGMASLAVVGVWNSLWLLMYASQLKHMT